MKLQKRQEVAHKDREKYMDKVKESILKDATTGGSRNTSNGSNDTTNTTTSATSVTNAITRSNESYTYDVGIVAVLAIDVSIFFCI